VRARLVIGADGPRSPLRRKGGLEGRPRGRVRLGLRAHFDCRRARPLRAWSTSSSVKGTRST
jgi:2-polyprenyl-6-methoxyphenol hydroxylase-like FAD-dependent oxidoreductase